MENVNDVISTLVSHDHGFTEEERVQAQEILSGAPGGGGGIGGGDGEEPDEG